jgi:hypothetical protein
MASSIMRALRSADMCFKLHPNPQLFPANMALPSVIMVQRQISSLRRQQATNSTQSRKEKALLRSQSHRVSVVYLYVL